MKYPKEVLNTEISSIELKAGQVICLRDTKTGNVHNMIVFPIGDKFGAVEELYPDDKITVNEETVANYCYINRDRYPDTMGVDTRFGDELTSVYPHIGFCKDEDGDVIEITYYNKDGVYCTRMC